VTKKDKSFLANPINPKSKKVVVSIPLKSVQMASTLKQAETNFFTQMQIYQIAEQIRTVQV